MIAESRTSTVRRERWAAARPTASVQTPTKTVETSGIPTERLLWLGSYLRTQKELSSSWILSEMGWLMENTTHALSEIINKAFDRLCQSIAAEVTPLIIERTPLLNIDSIQSKLTAHAVSVELESNYESSITGTQSDIDRALHMLLHIAPHLCAEDNVQQQFTLLDHKNSARLHISHPVTEIPPEMFDYLFGNRQNTAAHKESIARLELCVKKCSVSYNLDPTNRTHLVVLTIISSIRLVHDDIQQVGAFMPLTASFQCMLDA